MPRYAATSWAIAEAIVAVLATVVVQQMQQYRAIPLSSRWGVLADTVCIVLIGAEWACELDSRWLGLLERRQDWCGRWNNAWMGGECAMRAVTATYCLTHI